MNTGLHARRATRLSGAEREESSTRTESMARWSREGRVAYEAEISSAVRFLLTGARCSNQAGINTLEGTGFFFSFFTSKISFNFHCFRGAARYGAMLCISFVPGTYQQKKISMYRHSCGVRVVFLDGAWICKSPVCT